MEVEGGYTYCFLEVSSNLIHLPGIACPETS